jgi:hypothetical protein
MYGASLKHGPYKDLAGDPRSEDQTGLIQGHTIPQHFSGGGVTQQVGTLGRSTRVGHDLSHFGVDRRTVGYRLRDSRDGKAEVSNKRSQKRKNPFQRSQGDSPFRTECLMIF